MTGRACGRAGALGIALATGLSACAGAGRGPAIGGRPPLPTPRSRLLATAGDAVWRGDLGAADAALTQLADREAGRYDPALDFWSELVALLRCQPLTGAPGPARHLTDPWDRLRRLVQIERLRLARDAMATQATTNTPGAPAPRARRPRVGADNRTLQVVWPAERERWNDELPMPVSIDHCPQAAAAAHAPRPGEAEMRLVSESADTLPPEHPAGPVLLLHAAVLEIKRGNPGAAVGPLTRLEGLSGAAAAPGAPAPVLTAGERAQVAIAGAVAAAADQTLPPEAVLGRARALMAADVDPATRRLLQLRLAERLRTVGRVLDASAVLGPPPHGDDAVGRYIAFRQAEAHARGGRAADVLAEARAALGRGSRASVDADPALAAIMDLALRTLLASPVSDETLEVLESLGPPRERLGRAETFAEIALGAGAHESAMATFLWLHANDTDPARQLQYLARASVAAARAGNRREFARTFHLLAGQEDREGEGDAPGAAPARAAPVAARPGAAPSRAAPSPKAAAPSPEGRGDALIATPAAERVHEKRRATRSANWQRALLVVARDALPALVDADDQDNLATLVGTLKRHLGDGGRGPVDEELTTLYRAASAHLKTGPRAYAETIGAARRPIFLGDVMVGRRYDVPTPEVDFVPLEVGPLVFVPRTGDDPSPGALRRWPGHLGVAWTGGRS